MVGSLAQVVFRGGFINGVLVSGGAAATWPLAPWSLLQDIFKGTDDGLLVVKRAANIGNSPQRCENSGRGTGNSCLNFPFFLFVSPSYKSFGKYWLQAGGGGGG